MDDVLNVARTAKDLSLRAHALRRLLPVVSVGTLLDSRRDELLAEGVALATEGRDRLAWVEAAAVSANPAVLRAVLACMDDPFGVGWLWGPTRIAALAIAERIRESEPELAEAALERVGGMAARGGTEAAVPLSASTDSSPAESQPGVTWAAYRPVPGGNIRETRFEDLSPVAEGIADTVAPRAFLGRRWGRGLWVRFEGTLQAPSSGIYGFSLRSDREAALLIDGRERVVSSSGCDGVVTVELSEGSHPIEVRYVRGPLEVLILRWLPPAPGREVAALIAEALQRDAAAGLPVGEAVNMMEYVPSSAFRRTGGTDSG